MIQIRI